MTPQISASLPDLALLRELCVQRLRDRPLQGWTRKEGNVTSYLLGVEDANRVNNSYREPHLIPMEEEPLLAMIERDLNELDLPKWVTLISWLSKEGLANQYPETVGKIAKYCLGIDAAEIEKDIPKKFLNY